MTAGLTAALLAFVPFLHPVKLPHGARLWMVLPLVLCVAVVYRATRSRETGALAKASLITFVNIMLGMIAIALAFYLVHHAVLWLF